MSKKITVFTPTYNREQTLYRVYNSLINQTFKDFIWIVVDDGSTDHTKELIDKYINENKIEIKYIYQKNSGKHIAINTALQYTDTELFIIADSDDSFRENALEIFINEWDKIENKEKYKGIIARCYDNRDGKVIGKDFPDKRFDCNELDANFKYKLGGEKWSMFQTKVLREFPFPNITGLKFYPETIIWQKMSRKYITRYINIPLREYYKDQDNAITNKKNSRFKENIYLWEHLINNVYDYFYYNPLLFIKAHVGLIRDGLLNNYSLKKILSIPNRRYKKIITIMFIPIGKILYLKKNKKI